jgi:hypothetical protein
MNDGFDFIGFGKIPRLSREIVITEKIDGTNAQIAISEIGSFAPNNAVYVKNGIAILVGSRTRWITPSDDNAGFALWVVNHAEELLSLGIGSHYGEWWGLGIQRNYGLKEKRFSLFNTSRWTDDTLRPNCCHVVPELYKGIFDTQIIQSQLDDLATNGSKAAPGFLKPEGIIIYHTAANMYFKKTLVKDEEPKSSFNGR